MNKHVSKNVCNNAILTFRNLSNKFVIKFSQLLHLILYRAT